MMKLQGWVSGVIHIVIDNRYAGFIVISDEIKDDNLKAVRELKTIRIKKLVMLTGDSKPVSEKVYRNLRLDEVHAGLLPDHKLDKLE